MTVLELALDLTVILVALVITSKPQQPQEEPMLLEDLILAEGLVESLSAQLETAETDLAAAEGDPEVLTPAPAPRKTRKSRAKSATSQG